MPLSLRLSFAGQFLAFALVVLAGGMFTLGLWVEREIKEAVIGRTAAVSSLYANSLLFPHIDDLRDHAFLSDGAVAELDEVLLQGDLGEDLVAFKIWGKDGTIIYSPNQTLIGASFPVSADLGAAFDGRIVSGISALDEPENAYESQLWSSLIETYAPLRLEDSDEPIAVAEIYQKPDALLAEIASARRRSWLLVALATATMYGLLAGLAGRASGLMARQRQALEANVLQLGELAERNDRLAERVTSAAERTTALNEQYLRRISADIHDGPAQEVSMALLRLESLPLAGEAVDGADEIKTIGHALESAMSDLRSIAAGLRLPELEQLTPADTIERVVGEFERHSGASVERDVERAPNRCPLAVKITIYRVVQEALANSYRHAPGSSQRVVLAEEDALVVLRVSDDGPGFDVSAARTRGLGLPGIRERIELLGGTVEVISDVRSGTVITARIPTRRRGDSGD